MLKKTFLTVLFACLFAIGAMAQTTTPPPPPTLPGTVVRINFIDIKPGKGNDFSAFVGAHQIPIWEEQKKQGLLLDYKFFSQPTNDGPSDWDVAIVFVYKNYADALDSSPERNAKFDAISIGHYGSVEARTKANDQYNEIRTVISSQLMREQIPNMPKK